MSLSLLEIHSGYQHCCICRIGSSSLPIGFFFSFPLIPSHLDFFHIPVPMVDLAHNNLDKESRKCDMYLESLNNIN